MRSRRRSGSPVLIGSLGEGAWAFIFFLTLLCFPNREVAARPRPPLPPYPEAHVLYRWTWDEANWWNAPRGTALFAGGVGSAESWSGYSLTMEGDGPALVVLPQVDAAGYTNFATGSGALRFWVRPNWSSSDLAATAPLALRRLIELGTITDLGPEVWWSLYGTAEGLHLSGQDSGSVVDFLSAPVEWRAGEWRLVALSYGPTNAALYLDGQLVAQAKGVPPLPEGKAGTRVLAVGSSLAESSDLAQAEFEELTTFDSLAKPEDLMRYFEFTRQTVAGPAQPTLAASQAEAAVGGGVQPLSYGSGYDCDLWLEIGPASTNEVLLTLHNTFAGRTYQIWSKVDIAGSGWALETNVLGTAGDTQATVPMASRPILFFRAVEVQVYAAGLSFRGLDEFDVPAAPPDTMGAVGSNHFVEILNGKIAVFDKSTGQRLEQATNEHFFACVAGGTNYPRGLMYDPRILYDHQAHRWIASALDVYAGSRAVILAVSDTDSPTNLLSNWRKHLLPAARPPSVADYDTLGVDANGIYVSVMQLLSTNYQIVNAGHTIVAVKKPEIYTGTLLCVRKDETDGLTSWTIQPAVNFDDPPSEGHAWFVAKGPPQLTGDYQGGAIWYRRLAWAGTNADWVDASWRVVTDPLSPPTYRDYYDLDHTNTTIYSDAGGICAPQLGGPDIINLKVVGSRLMMAVVRNDYLWTCHHVGLDGTDGTYDGDATGATVDRSAIQWFRFQINSTGEPLTYSTHDRIYDACSSHPKYFYFPSLMVNSFGDMVVGFSGSSTTMYIGAFYSWRLTDGTKSVRPVPLRAGEGYYDRPRWGDYSYTSLDPIDGLTFWTVQEYASTPTEGVSIWGTWITRISDL